jgi:hypothetical protein
MLDRGAPTPASKTFKKAKSVYSSGVPESRPRRAKKPEWNPYKTTDDAYGRLTKKQLETRKEMFKSKNNILHSPEAKAKAAKEKVRERESERTKGACAHSNTMQPPND